MNKSRSGFTIVELLIVIVVIAILAAISVVAYSGIQNRTNDTAIQTDIRNYAAKIIEFYAINGRYPTTGGRGPAEGIPTFKIAIGSYATNVHNFYYCYNDSQFAVGAASKSGNKFFYSSSQGLKPYTATWNGATENCQGMGLPWPVSGFFYGYYLTDQTWSSWLQ